MTYFRMLLTPIQSTQSLLPKAVGTTCNTDKPRVTNRLQFRSTLNNCIYCHKFQTPKALAVKMAGTLSLISRAMLGR